MWTLHDLWIVTGRCASPTTSDSETFGLTNVEAAYCGAHVVSTNLPSAHEVLGDNILYFQPQDFREMGQLISQALAQQDHFTDDSIRARFGLEAVGARYLSLYKKALGK